MEKDIENVNAMLKLYDALNNGEIKEIKITRPEQVFDLEELSKDKVINDLLKRIASLEYEVERQDSILKKIDNYINKMSYASVIDNPREDLTKILKKEKHND